MQFFLFLNLFFMDKFLHMPLCGTQYRTRSIFIAVITSDSKLSSITLQ